MHWWWLLCFCALCLWDLLDLSSVVLLEVFLFCLFRILNFFLTWFEDLKVEDCSSGGRSGCPITLGWRFEPCSIPVSVSWKQLYVLEDQNLSKRPTGCGNPKPQVTVGDLLVVPATNHGTLVPWANTKWNKCLLLTSCFQVTSVGLEPNGGESFWMVKQMYESQIQDK